MASVFEFTFHKKCVPLDLDILNIADLRNSEMLCDLRSDLGRITVNGLAAGDDQIIIQFLQCGCDRGGCCPCIGASESRSLIRMASSAPIANASLKATSA